MSDIIDDIGNHILYGTGYDSLLNVSGNVFVRIKKGVSIQVFFGTSYKYVQSKIKPKYNLIHKYSNHILVSGLIVRTLFGYYVLKLLYTFIDIIHKIFINETIHREVNVVLLNSGSKVDRFSSLLIEIMESNYTYSHLQIFSKSIDLVHKYIKGNNTSIKFLPPISLSDDLISVLYKYSKEVSPIISQKMDSMMFLQLNNRLKINVHKHLINTIIHIYWGKAIAQMLMRKYPNAVFIFDQGGELGGKESAIIDVLNLSNAKTIVIQHGTSLDMKYYYPITKYIFCCSEREKNILINDGLEEERIFNIGAPFQVSAGFNIKRKSLKASQYLILAGAGPQWEQYKFIETILKSTVLKTSKNKSLRYHPSFNNYQKSMWKKALNTYEIRQDCDLIDEIIASDIIISFSIDAIIPAIYLSKKTIFVIYNDQLEWKYLNYLEEYPTVSVCLNAEAIDLKIKYLKHIGNKENDHNKFQYDYGSIDRRVIERNIKKSLNTILNI